MMPGPPCGVDMFFPCLRGKLGCQGPDGHAGQIADVIIKVPWKGQAGHAVLGPGSGLVMTPLVIKLLSPPIRGLSPSLPGGH